MKSDLNAVFLNYSVAIIKYKFIVEYRLHLLSWWRPICFSAMCFDFDAGNRGNLWQEARVSIPPQNRSWNIILQATRGQGVKGDIAIDDFALLGVECKSTSP